MNNSTELRQVIYKVLLTQIQFGIYPCGKKLPTIEEASARFCVSIDTVRAAYLQLKEAGYIALSKNVGATVKADYTQQETEQAIQAFFAARKKALVDLGDSMRPLFGNAQWVGLKHASPETLRAMEQLCREENAVVPYAMLEHLNLKYSALGNGLLMRLVWQTFMFLHAPFFCPEENLRYFDESAGYLPEILSLCRKGDWAGLRAAVARSIDRLTQALTRFYGAAVTAPSPEKEICFTWSSYKKSQQRCYSLAMELLISISRGIYPPGNLLPSQTALAAQKGVSVSTIRRAFALLASVGAIKSTQYVGTQVLPLEAATENSDFRKPVLQRRLVDMAESLQIFALSCKDVSLLTLSSLDSVSVQALHGKLSAHKQTRRGETLSYFVLDLIAKYAPYQAIRTVYSELLRQTFWGYALRGIKGSQGAINATYDPYFDGLTSALETLDFPRFSAALEALILYDLRNAVESLSQLGVPGAEQLLLPDRHSPPAW